MSAVIPAPITQVPDATASPFHLSSSARIVADGRAKAASAIAGARVKAATGLVLSAADGQAYDGDIVLRVSGSGAPESYTLHVGGDGAHLTGADEAGLFYAVQTFAQLAAASGPDGAIAPVRITDGPRFAYRGVMLDVARHFFDVDTVLRYIDHASALKFNALHLHLSDDQGWRLELTSHPELTEKASSSAIGGDAGGFYTQADYTRIVEYAAARHMIVVPEFDGPGHTHAVGLALPELAEQPVITDVIRQTVADFGGELPAAGVPYDGLAVGFSSLRIHHEPTYDFLADVYGELARLTPGPYLHVGGDEALGTDPDDFSEYMSRVTRLVSDLGKTPVAWHEAGAADRLAPDTIGQYWGFVTPTDGMDEKSRTFVRNGAKLILSPADAIYLDMKYDADSPLGLTWANGPTNIERSYRWDPATVIEGIEESDILGVEAALWTETVRTPADIDTQAFPRIASAAEAAWSPAEGPERTWESFRARLGALGALWEREGIGFFHSPEITWTAGE